MVTTLGGAAVARYVQLVIIVYSFIIVAAQRPYRDPRKSAGYLFVMLMMCLSIVDQLLVLYGYSAEAAVVSFVVVAMLILFAAAVVVLALWDWQLHRLWSVFRAWRDIRSQVVAAQPVTDHVRESIALAEGRVIGECDLVSVAPGAGAPDRE